MKNDEVMKILPDNSLDVNKQDKNGRTALMDACNSGSTKKGVEMLLKCGANVNMKDDLGQTALMIACSINAPKEVVEILLDNNAEMNMKDDLGQTALMVACAMNAKAEVIELLLKRGANVNMKSDSGRTALMIACKCAKKEVIKLLIDCGADVNMKNIEGQTALMIACKCATKEVVKLLLKNGVEVNAQGEDGQTALMYACDVNAPKEVIELLLDNGAKADMQDKDGQTALMGACGSNAKAEVIELLLKRGAGVNKRDKGGLTALMYTCVMNAKKKVVELLVKNGAEVNMQSENGKTALMYACTHNAPKEIIEYLIDNGADMYNKDNKGRTLISMLDSKARAKLLGAVARIKLRSACAKNNKDEVEKQLDKVGGILPKDLLVELINLSNEDTLEVLIKRVNVSLINDIFNLITQEGKRNCIINLLYKKGAINKTNGELKSVLKSKLIKDITKDDMTEGNLKTILMRIGDIKNIISVDIINQVKDSNIPVLIDKFDISQISEGFENINNNNKREKIDYIKFYKVFDSIKSEIEAEKNVEVVKNTLSDGPKTYTKHVSKKRSKILLNDIERVQKGKKREHRHQGKRKGSVLSDAFTVGASSSLLEECKKNTNDDTILSLLKMGCDV
ncbi:MAG: ankyrin repeat domain-containing protein, partial [Clostridiales bacterium]|nr:ankyrin repeat domain-containing protein [Clostridiales bacterium]